VRAMSRSLVMYLRRFLVFLFFFSSRRRHTRLVSDWSSDVCSSDLARSPIPEIARQPWVSMDHGLIVNSLQDEVTGGVKPALLARSEERRVGKERRYWGAGDQ